jgi:hypothetical protein
MFDLTNSFPGKEKREAVYVFARPYFVAFLPTALIFLFIFSSALVFQLGVAQNFIGGFSDDIANPIILFVGLFQLFVIIIFFVTVLDFYYDIVIVTDRRVVDINQEQLFFRSISELNLEDVEDVNSSVSGILPTLFGYGTIVIQTAGEHENFIAQNFRFPREIASIVSDLAQQAKKHIPEEDRVPETQVLGVINDEPVTDFNELKRSGAITTDDPRRIPGNP